MADQMRDDFEAWYAAELKGIEDKMPEFSISTLRFSKEVLRTGWKASRVALLKCPCCGLTDTEIQKVCSNSACAEYAHEITLFKGWG